MRGHRPLVRSAAWLFIVAGVVTLVDTWIPGSGVLNANVVDGLGLTAIVVGILTWLAPWERWPVRASLLLVPIALSLIGLYESFGIDSPFTYAVYFVVTFTWVGLVHPRRTSLALAPLAAVVYELPILTRHEAVHGAAASGAVAVPVCVLVGETVAWAMAQMADARRQAEHRARLLRAVVRGTTTITTLDYDRVLDGVVDSVIGLGMQVAGLAVFSTDGATYRLHHVRGLPEEMASADQPASAGLPALVRSQRGCVVLDDYATNPAALRHLVEAGVRAAMGAPVWVHGEMAAVLLAGGTRTVTDEDAEALTLLANHAGRTLENAQIYGEEREARRFLAEVSMRDELTGIGNRRHAMALLESLKPGDAVVMIDLDHFKEVNDSEGHDAGDRVLLELADYLRRSIRDADLVARYGGEEFLVVLREAADSGVETAQRLVAGWRDLRPRTTFSAGVAVHTSTSRAPTTVARADAALYAAKRTGRDRVCENLVETS
ncbi:MAG TPA: sensor domain-containing diguanylate cyclase [Acidimicrobiales bacterium]|nr:sensor domain-containing diguanylate cyclase [Acidimicrobiales bacterium]